MTREMIDLAAHRSARPGMLLTAGRAAAFAVTFAAPLVLARIFSEAEFGTYKQIMILSATVLAIAQLGMADSLLYFLPSEPRRSGRYVLQAMLVLAGSGAICLAAFAAGGGLLGSWFGNASLPPLSVLLGASLLLLLPAAPLEIVLTARRRYAAAGLVYGLSDLIRVGAIVAAALVMRSLEGVLVAIILFGVVRLAAMLLFTARAYGGEMAIERGALRAQLGYALPLQLGVALWILAQNLHYYIVAAKMPPAVFALYAVGCLQIPIVDILSTPARNLLTLGVRGAVTAQQPRTALDLWHDTVRRLALVFFPLVGLLVAGAGDLIPVLFTDRYAAAAPILMCWSTIALVLAMPADGVLAAYGDTRVIALTQGLQLLLIALLVPVLMGPLGLVGAVAGTVLAVYVCRGLLVVRAGGLMRVGAAGVLPWRVLAGLLAAAAIAMMAALVIRSRLEGDPLPRLLLTAAAYGAVYLAILAAWDAGVRAAVVRDAKEIAAAACVASGLARAATRLNRRKALVLLYHGVHGGEIDPVRNYDDLHVRAGRFRAQMRYIASRYRVVPLDRILEPRSEADGRPLAAITFDDGYGGLFLHARPVLRELGLPATVFVTTDFLEGRGVPWWDRLAAMAAASPRRELCTDLAGSRSLPLGTAAQKREALRVLTRELLALPPARREAALGELACAFGVAGTARFETPPSLTADQLRTLSEAEMTVGGHGCTHDSFLHLDRAQLAAELARSKAALEAVTGGPVRWLAYPYGQFGPEAAAAAKEAGYVAAVTAIEEGLNDGIPDPFAVRRIGVSDSVSFMRFIVAVSGLRDMMRRWRKEDRDARHPASDRRAVVPGPGIPLPARAAEEAGPAD